MARRAMWIYAALPLVVTAVAGCRPKMVVRDQMPTPAEGKEAPEVELLPPAPAPGLFPGSPIPALAEGATLMPNLGTLHVPITTTSKEAQKWFDQGMRLLYAFNHDEAARSFARAAELDGSCAMCFWGVALVLGPNYNAPMLPDRAVTAWAALQRARELVGDSNPPVEHALIGALTTRYKGPEALGPEAMHPYSVNYAAAMADVAHRFPHDDDVQVLYAEALMDANPWALWSRDGLAAKGTDEILTALRMVLNRNPSHPGANHYYIHAVEASPNPGQGVAEADRLPSLIPGAGHILHMPAHIYQRVGRYAEASVANARAITADLEYIKAAKPTGVYPMYLAHDYGFLSFSSAMEGRCETAVAAARAAASHMPPEMMDMMPGMDFFAAEPILALVRCGRWSELLAEPRPDPKYLVLSGLWLHGHGMALAATGRFDEAMGDLGKLMALAQTVPPVLCAGNNKAADVFAVAGKILEARIAQGTKQPDAIALWTEAVVLADHLAYSEPDDWYYPVRHYLGAALLEKHDAALAEQVYRTDLERNPRNGWALFGLWQSLKAQHKQSEADEAHEAFSLAWPHADVKLSASAFF